MAVIASKRSKKNSCKIHIRVLLLVLIIMAIGFPLFLVILSTSQAHSELLDPATNESPPLNGHEPQFPGKLLRGEQQSQQQQRSATAKDGSASQSASTASRIQLITKTKADIAKKNGNDPSGTHPFQSSLACSKQDASCWIHYPVVDLKNVIEKDEALLVASRFRSLNDDKEEGKMSESNKNSELQIIPLKGDSHQEEDNHVVLTRCGFKSYASGVKLNQDRSFAIAPFLTQTSLDSRNFLMGIFDGHGGEGQKVSNFAVTQIPSLLAEKLDDNVALTVASQSSSNNNENDGTIQQALRETFIQKAIRDTFLQFDKSIPFVMGAGSTASMILRVDDKLYMTNLGDSESFLATYTESTKAVKVVYVTKKHKPHMPEEKARIEAAGGQILLPPPHIPGVPDDSSRIVIPVGFQELALAMSRSLGDIEGKNLGLTAEPTVDILSITDIINDNGDGNNDKNDVHLFAVSASDGLLDYVPIHEVAQTVAESLYQTDTPRLLDACQQLIMKSSELWIKETPYRDDISISVSRVII